MLLPLEKRLRQLWTAIHWLCSATQTLHDVALRLALQLYSLPGTFLPPCASVSRVML